ncbi:MAG: 1-acyl-sn-glycerol-3-phosphate acyltransferase [Spirochaetales bacterium]|nr:1-acyl-sn-glycerol-3-phosphate acyltransferase [Spirochaetales bacterium]
MIPINDAYKEVRKKLIKNSSIDKVITEDNVYQEGLATNKPLISQVVSELMLPGSRINGFENLLELYELAQTGKSCILFMQHFSNFDIPNFYELLERHGEIGEKVSQSIVSIAGMKLNEENDFVRSFTEAYTRVVIYPSSTAKNTEDTKKKLEEKIKQIKINRAALHAITHLKHNKRIILVFPTGTRFRPWDESTGKGLKAVYSYLKTFNYMVCVAINGNTLRLNPSNKMDEDFVTRDVVMYTVSKVFNCKEFRTQSLKHAKLIENSKQHVVDDIIKELDALHKNAEFERVQVLKQAGRKAI